MKGLTKYDILKRFVTNKVHKFKN